MLYVKWANSLDRVNKNHIITSQDVMYHDAKIIKKRFSNLNDYTKLEELCRQDNHLYELITTDKCKVYFDIDCFKQSPISIAEFNTLMGELMTILSEELVNHKFKLIDFAVLINDNYKTVGVKSIHLVCKKFSMIKKEQRLLCDIINYKLDNKCVGCGGLLDTTVYKSNQQFRLSNQSKLGKDYRLILYDNDNTIFIDTIISAVDNTEFISYTKDINSIIDECEQDDKKIRILIKKKEIIDCLDNVNDTFYLNGYDWKQVCRIIKKLYPNKLEEFNKLSLEKSYGRWSDEENDVFIDSIDTDEVKSGLYTLLKIINKNTNHKYYVIDEKNAYLSQRNLLENYLKNNKSINIEYKEIQPTKHEHLFIHQNYLINLKNGFIDDTDTEKRCNFIYTTDLKLKHQESSCEFSMNTINHIRDIDIKQWVLSDSKYLFVKSDWATGKSHYILKPSVNLLHGDNSIAVITESNALNSKNAVDLNEYGFKSHLDFKNNKSGDKLKNHKYIITSEQSLPKLHGKKYDIIILDEFESIFNGFNGSNFDTRLGSQGDCLKCLYNLIQNAKKVICLDADLDTNRVKLLLDSINNYTVDIPFYINTQNEYSDYKYLLYDKKDNHYNSLIDKLNNGNKIAFGSASKNRSDLIYEDLCKNYEKRKIMYINVNGVETNYGLVSTKNNTIENLEFYLKEVDVFIYTPTISVGISVNTELFDYTFIHGHHESLNAYKFLQMFFRLRRVKSKELHICLENWTYTSNHISTNQVKYHTKNKTRLLNSECECENIHNEDYLNMYCLSECINQNSKKSYGRELINLLNIHNLSYVWVYDKKINIELLDTLVETKEELEVRLKNEFNEAEIYEDIYEYKRLQKLTVESPEDIDAKTKTRLMKTNLLYINKDIYKLTEQLRDHDVIIKDEDEIKSLVNKNIANFIDYDETQSDYLYNSLVNKQQVRNIRKYNNELKLTDDLLNTHIINSYDEFHEKHILYNRLQTVFFNPTDKRYKIITNTDFKQFIMDCKPLIIEIFKTLIYKFEPNDIIKWIQQFSNKKLTDYDNKYIKQIYHKIKDIYSELDVSVKYIDGRNTFRDTDRILIQNLNKIIRYSKHTIIQPQFKHFENQHQEVDYTEIKELDIKTADKLCTVLNNKFNKEQHEKNPRKEEKSRRAKRVEECKQVQKLLLGKYYKPTTDIYFNELLYKKYVENDVIVREDKKRKLNRYYSIDDKKVELFKRDIVNGKVSNFKPYTDMINKHTTAVKQQKQYIQIPHKNYDYGLQDVIFNLNAVIDAKNIKNDVAPNLMKDILNHKNIPKLINNIDHIAVNHIKDLCDRPVLDSVLKDDDDEWEDDPTDT